MEPAGGIRNCVGGALTLHLIVTQFLIPEVGSARHARRRREGGKETGVRRGRRGRGGGSDLVYLGKEGRRDTVVMLGERRWRGKFALYRGGEEKREGGRREYNSWRRATRGEGDDVDQCRKEKEAGSRDMSREKEKM